MCIIESIMPECIGIGVAEAAVAPSNNPNTNVNATLKRDFAIVLLLLPKFAAEC